MKYLLVAIVLVLSAQLSWASDFTFRGISFGEAPQETMLCVRGNCPDTTPMFSKRLSFPNAIYTSIEDITVLGDVPITAPEYDFFQGKLYRIRFTLKCTRQYGAQTIDAIRREIQNTYGYYPKEIGAYTTTSKGQFYSEKGATFSGDEVVISWTPDISGEERPKVLIQNVDLLKQAQLASIIHMVEKR